MPKLIRRKNKKESLLRRGRTLHRPKVLRIVGKYHLDKWFLGLVVYLVLVYILVMEGSFVFPLLDLWKRVAGIGLLVLIFMFLVVFYLKKYSPRILSQTSSLFLLGLIFVGTMVLGKLLYLLPLEGVEFLIPVASAAMLTSVLLEGRLALIIVLALSIFVGLLTGSHLDSTMVGLVSGGVAVFYLSLIRRRSEFIRAGLYVSFANLMVISGIGLLHGRPWEVIGIESSWGVGNGILSAFLAAGALPVLEFFFKIATDARLLELSDLNQPLLKELREKAPGTYQSSLAVANLAEAASELIGVDPLLVRVGAYYHDIGKLNKPSYYSENQNGVKNVHERVSPSLSSLILISHIKDGVAFARKTGLPSPLIDIIKQHHGTTFTSFFYQEAMEKGELEGREEDYRYPGPKPQTKEAALIMLADSVEAASRSLSNPTPSRIRKLVDKIINDKFTDYQLEECDLTLKDLHNISESFATTLTGMLHTRVNYPPGGVQGGNSNKKLPKKSKGKP